MTILIAGAGIGGLTLALSLHAVGMDVKVFEAVKEIKPLGVGINLQPHAVRELEALGLLDELDKIGLRTKEVAYFSTHGSQIWSEPRGKFAGYNWPQFSIHRGKLQMLLLSAVKKRLGPDAVRSGAAVESWTQSDEAVEVQLFDREANTNLEKVHGSILVGADGLHSNVRSHYYPDEGAPKWGGIIMWRGVSKAPPYLGGRSMAMVGCKKRKFVCYPIAEENGVSTINWIADLGRPPQYLWNKEDWNRLGKLEDFLPQFENWNFDWLNITQVIKDAQQTFEFPMIDRDPLPAWTFERVTLLGDAAHPMYPIGSNGATQAIIDARVLVRELLKHGSSPQALKSYEAERLPITAKVVLANRGDGPDKVLDIVEQRAPDGFDNLEDVLSHQELKDVAGNYKKIAGFDVEALNKAKSILA